MKEKILKLLQQTTTDSDNEALNAIRMANAILKKKDLHWDEFFSTPGPASFSRENNALKRKIILLEKQVEFLKAKESLDIRNPHIGDPNIRMHSERENVSTEEKLEICLEAMPYNALLHSLSDIWNARGKLTVKELKSLDVIYFNH